MSVSIEKIIRKDTGIGAFNAHHIAWLQTLVKIAFHTLSSVLIFYTEKSQHYIYLFPTDKPNDKNPRESQPISKEQYDLYIKDAESMLRTMVMKTEFFAQLVPYYKIKITRKLPQKVLQSEKLSCQ